MARWMILPLLRGFSMAAASRTAWLRERVAPHAGDPAGVSLPEAVSRFQAAHGLLADAVIGPETLFALAASDPGPHLLRTLD